MDDILRSIAAEITENSNAAGLRGMAREHFDTVFTSVLGALREEKQTRDKLSPEERRHWADALQRLLLIHVIAALLDARLTRLSSEIAKHD